MVGFISPRLKSITMDGPMDVPTPSTIPMRKAILGTPFRTLRDDWLCSTPRFKTIWDKIVYSSYCHVSFIRDHLWQARRGPIAQSDHTGMEEPT